MRLKLKLKFSTLIMALGIRYNAPVILTFSILAAAIFFINQSMLNSLDGFVSLNPYMDFSNPFQIPTLFTYVLGHASIDHLLGNLTFILLLGPIMEEKYGSTNMLIMILATALITAIINISFFSTGLWGASGIVFMLIILVSFANVKDGEIPVSFILVVLLFIGKEILHSLQADQVSQFAHILGGVCGGFFGFSGIMKKRVE